MQNPAGLHVGNEQAEFGKDAGQQVVQLIGQPRRQPRLPFEASDDLTQMNESVGRGLCGFGLLEQSETGRTKTFDRVGLAFGKEGQAVVLITGRLANGDGFRKRELAQKGLEVGGILAGRVEADMEMHIGEALVNVVKEAADVVIACLGLDELGRGADGVEPAIEKRNVMAITSGVKADTDGHDRVESSSRIGHGANSRKKANAGKQAVRPPQSFDVGNPCDERSSRKMQQNLRPRSEGSIFRKRSSLRG